jgi:hypothetical protein
LGNGDGTFGPKADFNAGDYPQSVAIGDLNLDGKADLVVASDLGTVSWMFGNGNASFYPPNSAATIGQMPTFAAIADVNGDSWPDLVVTTASSFGGGLSVFFGHGTQFDSPWGYSTGGNYPVRVAIGDLNGDGKPDLAVANYSSGTVAVLLGTGNGYFGEATTYQTAGASSVAIGDLNGDGTLDLALAGGESVSLLMGNGDGTFGGDPTATLLSLFEARWVDAAIEVRWQYGPGADVAHTALERAPSESGPWTVVTGSPQTQGGVVTLVDHGVVPGHPSRYRLQTTTSIGQSVVFGPIAVSGELPAEFALLPVTPNPSAGDAQIAFTIPRLAPVRVSVLDVQGRQVAVLADGLRAAGRYQVAWGGRSSRARAGLYFVRFQWPDGAAIRRIALTR